jgi:hypothetical protein
MLQVKLGEFQSAERDFYRTLEIKPNEWRAFRELGNLMLNQAVIDAVAQGLFAIYAVSNVDEALSILMNQAAGSADDAGAYPEDSINFKAVARLKEISDMAGDEDKETDSE